MRPRTRRGIAPAAALTVCVAAALACNQPGIRGGVPDIIIQEPSDGDSLPVGEPVVIAAVATDPEGPGVSRVELFINGDSIRTVESPTGPRDVFDVALSWTPDDEGDAEITVIATREDGAPSAPASVAVEIVGVTVSGTEEAATEEATEEGATPTPRGTPRAGEAVITGRVVMNANIRSLPGPLCTIVGGVEANEIINLLEYSADRRWLKTDYGGRIGWIYAQSVAPLGNTSEISIGTARGCQGCGDRICRGSESCSTCSRDCGACTPTPTNTPTRTPTLTPTVTVTRTPTVGVTITATTAVPTVPPATPITPTLVTITVTAAPTVEPTLEPTLEPTVEPGITVTP